MKLNIKISIIALGAGLGGVIFPLLAADIPLPAGFEDIFNSKQNAIFDIVYEDVSVGSIAVEYTQKEVQLLSPKIIVEQLSAPDMPELNLSNQALLSRLSVPIERVRKEGFSRDNIVAYIDESSGTLRLIFPESLFVRENKGGGRIYVPYKNKAGFIHSHNLNYLSDSYGDSLSLYASDTLNMTGNSYIKGSWSYAKEINFSLEELAWYLESDRSRFKLGRQQLNDNLTGSTPSMAYSFYNPVSFDGLSLGYMNDNYLQPGMGAASPVMVYLPMAGVVEVYRNERLIDLQRFPAGLQQLDTSAWPTGGYDVALVVKLVNGSQERKRQPFFKRNGTFRAGDVEYLIQMGRYDPHKSDLLSRTAHSRCSQCADDNIQRDIGQNTFAGVSLGYTTSSALSLGSSLLMDNETFYAGTSLDIPVNSPVVERVALDGIYGQDGSAGYQIGAMKNFERVGMNVSYRDHRYRGSEDKFRRFGVVPAYDFQYLQFGVTTFLPWNIGLGANYGLNTFYQAYGRHDKSDFKSWDVNLSRDFTLSERLSMRLDLGYHRGQTAFLSRDSEHAITEDRLFAQVSLGMHERSYNHTQALYLRARADDSGMDNNAYSANYSLDLDNPDFDRGGKYTFTANANHGPLSSNNGGVGVTVNNSLGYTSVGVSRTFGKGDYNQQYVSQRSGFAIGDGTVAYGRMDNNAALIVDATDLPKDQYFEVRNRSSETSVVKGGAKTTLAIQPYQKVAPVADQVFTGETRSFFNLTTESTSTWAKPGQVYRVKLSATKNQTVVGRLYFDGQPLANARVVGGNAMSDEEGLFVGDFTLKSAAERLDSLTVKKEGQGYICPLLEQNVKVTQGVMQIREVNCEIQ